MERARFVAPRTGVALTVIVAILLNAAPAHDAVAAGAPANAHPRTVRSSAACAKRITPKGTITYSGLSFPDNLNPMQSNVTASVLTMNTMFDPLLEFDNNARLFPVLATQVPTVRNGGITDGGKTITVRLRSGIRWSNGAELTSADVRFGWQIGMDKLSGPLCSGTCDVIKRVDTPDRYTAVLRLSRIYAPAVPAAMPPVWPTRWPGAWNNNAHAAANKLAQDKTFTFEGPDFPTNGPYQVTQFIRDDRIVLRPMKFYRTLACGASVKHLIYSFYSSKASVVAAAANGQTDVTSATYTLSDLPLLRQHPNAFRVYVKPGFIYEHLEFNVDKQYHGKPNPLSDANVRLALALALDRYGLIQSALGIGRNIARSIAAWSFLVNTRALVQPYADRKVVGQWDPLAGKFIEDTGHGRALQDAKRLLSRSHYPGGFSIDLFLPGNNSVSRLAAAGVMASNWQKLGVTINLNASSGSKLFDSWQNGGILAHGDFQAWMGLINGGPDPDLMKFNMQSKYIDREQVIHSAINLNASGIHDSVIDRAYDVAAHTLDRRVRSRRYSAIQRRMNERAYWIGLYFRPYIVTADNRVGNFSDNPIGLETWNAYAWRVKVG